MKNIYNSRMRNIKFPMFSTILSMIRLKEFIKHLIIKQYFKRVEHFIYGHLNHEKKTNYFMK